MPRFLRVLALLLALTLPVYASAVDRPIARVWHGKTLTVKADEYARYLDEQIQGFRKLPGNLGFQMLRQAAGDETHFLVISYWTSLAAITAYAGQDIQRVHPLARDAEFLIAPETSVMNYQIVDDAKAGVP